MFFVTGNTVSIKADEIVGALKENLTGIQSMVEDIDKQFSSLAETIGAGREQAFLLKQTLTEGLTEITRLGGGVANILEQQKALYTTFGTQLVLNKNATDELYATTQATGVEASVLFENYANVGKSIYSANEEMATIMESTSLIGVNAQKVAGLVANNMKELSRFNFKDGVTGLADMAAKSTMLRVDMASSVASAKKLYAPEAAQDFVNTLQRLGATGSAELMDVERVRYLARNEPQKLQEEIAKMSAQFVDETGKMSAVGMDFLDEIQGAAGYSSDELAKMGIAFSQLQEKQQIIKKTGLIDLPEDQMTKLENIMTKGKDGKFEVTYTQDGQQVTKALQDMSSTEQEKLQDFLEKQNEAIKETFEAKPGEDKNLVKLIEQQMDVNSKFTNAVEALKTVIPSQVAGSKEGEELVKTIAENTNKLSTTALSKMDELSDEAGKLISAKIEVMGKVTDTISTKMPVIVDSIEALATTITANIGTTVATLTNVFGDLATFLTDTFKLDDFISLPGNDRLIMGPEGSIGRINEKDTIISSTDGPKTEEEVRQMMEMIKSPKNPLVSTPIETKPLLITETLSTQQQEKMGEMMRTLPATEEERTKKIETSNKHEVDFKIDLANVPSNMDKDMVKSIFENMIFKEEFIKKVESALKSVQPYSYGQ